MTRRSAVRTAFVVAVLGFLLAVPLVVGGAGLSEIDAGAVGPGEIDVDEVGPGETSVSTMDDTRTSTPAAIDPREVGSHSTDDSETIRLEHGLFMIEELGVVGVETRATIPDRVTEVEVTLRTATEGTVEPRGFERVASEHTDESVWEWDGATSEPSLTYLMNANETTAGDGPIAADGAYRFVDAGDWALVRTPRTGVSWSYTGQFSGQVGLERETVVDDGGVASQSMAFLGPYEEHVREGTQRYRLIVPEAASLEADPEELFDAFEHADANLPVGAADETVFAVAAPTGTVDWGVRGLQSGDADLWVRDEETRQTPDDVWTHEYVHTRQQYQAEPDARWFTEATATYYAALFALDRGDIDFVDFERALGVGERDPDASAVLASPETWDGSPDYTKGALVAGELDRQIRVESDGAASLTTVFRDLNDAGDPIANADILDAVESAAAAGGDNAGAAVRADAERFTTTAAGPETWDQREHTAAFGETPARVSYTLADDSVRAASDYRDRPIDRDPVELVTGETLELATTVTNTGGVAGAYNLTLTVDGDTVESRAGTVEPATTTAEHFEYLFAEPGEYTVQIGSETLSIVVTEPASVSVRDVTAVPAEHVGDGGVRVTATVGTDAGIPAAGAVEFRVDETTVDTASVRLDSRGELSIEREIPIDSENVGSGASGSVTISVVGPIDEATTTIDIDWMDTASDDGAGGSDVGAPGFGAIAALVALLVVTTVGRRCRSR